MAMGKIVRVKRTKKVQKKVPSVIKTYVKRVIDRKVEDKYQTVALPTVFGSIGNDWTDVCLTNPSQGVDVINRVGRTINIKSIEMRGTVANGSYSGTTADDGYDTLRCVVGVWTSTSPLHLSAVDINQPLCKDTFIGEKLIRKLSDRYIALNTTGTYNKVTTSGFVPQLKNFRYYKRFKHPLQIKFSDSGNSTADKALVISMISDSTAVPHVGFTVGYIIVRYEDA